MTKYELFQKEYIEAIEQADRDIDEAIARTEKLIVEEGHNLRTCEDAKEKIYHEHTLSLLQSALTIMKDTRQVKLEEYGRRRAEARKELDRLRKELDMLTRRKAIKVSRIRIKFPLVLTAMAAVVALGTFINCTVNHQGGLIPRWVAEPNWIISPIMSFLRSCGEWENTLLQELGINLFLLDFSRDIIRDVAIPALPCVTILLTLAVIEFGGSLVIRVIQRLTIASRKRREKRIIRRMQKLGLAAVSNA